VRLGSIGKFGRVGRITAVLSIVVLLLTACLTKLSSEVRQLGSELKVGMDIGEVIRKADNLAREYKRDLIYENSASRPYTDVERVCRTPASDVVCAPANLPNSLSKDASGNIGEKAVRLLVLGRFPYGFSQSLTVFYKEADRRVIGWIYSE